MWAVAAEHQGAYLFPRDCPRVLLWAVPTPSAPDRDRWVGNASMAAFIEEEWRERLATTRVYRYTVPAATFAPLAAEGNEWMWVSREPVRPTAVDPVDDLARALQDAGVVLQVVPSLTTLAPAWQSSVHASGIRLQNARTWTV